VLWRGRVRIRRKNDRKIGRDSATVVAANDLAPVLYNLIVKTRVSNYVSCSDKKRPTNSIIIIVIVIISCFTG